MTGYPRTARINDLIRAELADLLRRKVKDPRGGSVSVTAVITAPDLSPARALVSLLEPSAVADEKSAGVAVRIGPDGRSRHTDGAIAGIAGRGTAGGIGS